MIYKRKRHDSDLIHTFKKFHLAIGVTLTFVVYTNVITGFLIGNWNDLV
jgi:uncharacterized membrane protein